MLHDNKNIGNSTRKNFKRFVSVATFLQKHFYKYKKRNNSFSFSKARHFSNEASFVTDTLADSLVRHTLLPLHLPIHSCDTLCYHYTCRFTRVGPLQSLQRAFLRDLYTKLHPICLAAELVKPWLGSWELELITNN